MGKEKAMNLIQGILKKGDLCFKANFEEFRSCVLDNRPLFKSKVVN